MSAGASGAVLVLEGVGREYEGPPTTRALADIDLTVNSGEFVAIVGPSGSGTSTLLNLIGALDRPTEGAITIGGHRVEHLSDRDLSLLRGQQIGFIFQTFNLIDGLDAADNVGLGLVYRGVSRRERRRRALESLEHVGLAHRSMHRPGQLSGGERQRVAIARALVGRPSIVLADEPTGNLDSANGGAILEILDDLHRAGSTIVLITHDETVAARLPRRLTMSDGRLTDDSQRSSR